MPDRPSFNGASRELAEFLFKMRNYLHALPANTTEQQRMSLVIGQLEGAAATYIRGLQDGNHGVLPFNTVEELLHIIAARFQDDTAAYAARQRLDSFTQRGTVQAYNERFFELYLESSGILTEREALYLYVRGLTAQVQMFVRFREPDNLRDAMRYAVDAQLHIRATQAAAAHRPNHDRAGPSNTAGASTSGATPMELGAMTASSPPRQPRCWNCGQHGHVYTRCPATRNPKLPFKPSDKKDKQPKK